MTEHTAEGLATRAAGCFRAYVDGDAAAMDRLVDLLTPILWHTARAQGVGEATAQDAVQTAWLRLVERAGTIREAQAVMGWLIVTVRRECWRLQRMQSRTDHELDETRPDSRPDPATVTVRHAEHILLWSHVEKLDARCQALLRVIAFADRPDYAAVSEALKMPLGSIGPTRGRCLAKLRASLTDDPSWGGAL